MICFNPKDIKSKIDGYVGDKYSKVFTEDFINKTINNETYQNWFQSKGITNPDEKAIKSLLMGYMSSLQYTNDNEKAFFNQNTRKELQKKLISVNANNGNSIKEFIDFANKSIIKEKLVNQGQLNFDFGGNVEIKQDLTLADYGVETSNGAQDLLSKWRGWVKSNPHGIVAYRTDRNKFSDPKYALETRSMDNPFMGWLKDGQKGRDTELFRNWLLTGENEGNSLATEELRQAYLQLINDAAKNNAKVLYYTNIPPSQSHASVIGDLIRNPKQIEAIVTNAELQQDLGGGEEAKQEIKDAVSVAVKGMSFEKALEGQESFFTKEEQEKIKQSLDGKKLQVMSVSRLTDPAFFAKEIVSFLEQNAKKDLSDPTRVQAIEIWSKHDGLPIKSILDACKKYRVAPMVSFSITGLGGTSLEGGVMKYKDMLQKVGELVKNGTLNPTTTTVRIDPILVGVTSLDDIKDIVKTAKSFGIKKFVTSLVQSYGYTEGTSSDRKVVSGINNALTKDGKTYDWNEYYGRITNEDVEESNKFVSNYRKQNTKASWNEIVSAGMKQGIRVVTKNNIGKIHFVPKLNYIKEVGNTLVELDKDPEITIQTCSFNINGLKVSACLDPMIIERIVGTNVINPDGTYDRDTSRPECMCYGCHSDFFKGQNKKCYSSCAYCYAAHSGDNKLNYYNEDGTIKDNDFTRTEQPQPTVAKNATTNFDVSNAEFYSGAAEGSDTEWGKQARALGIKVKDYKVENFDKLSDDWKARIEKEYLESRAFLGKRPIKGDTYGGKLTRRDMMQADKADAIFAIAERIVNPGGIEYSGGKEYTNNTDHDNVQGGTANAVARGILRGIPIYVYDQSDNQWKQWNAKSKSFEAINDVPTLTQHAAVIGTRGINDDGKAAIKSILNKTINSNNKDLYDKEAKQEQQPSQQPQQKNSTKIKGYLTMEKINSTVVKSNYAASELFNTQLITQDNDIESLDSFTGVDAIILFSNDRNEINRAIRKTKKNKQIIYINPSDEKIKDVFDRFDSVGIFKCKNTYEKNIDNIYQNVRIVAKPTNNSTKDFISNRDLTNYARKITYYYNQLKKNNIGQDKDLVLQKVKDAIQDEYDNLSDDTKNSWIGSKFRELLDNFAHINSLITITETVDTDEIEDYENTNQEDPLYVESHSTSNMPKDDILAGLLSSFVKEDEVDELFTPITYEPMVVNNILTRTISGSKNSADMIKRLENKSRIFSWMKTLVDNINNDQSQRLRSILFTKYANLYPSHYITVNGNKIVDETTGFANTSVNLGIVVNPDPEICLFQKGNLNTSTSEFNIRNTESILSVEELFSTQEGKKTYEGYLSEYEGDVEQAKQATIDYYTKEYIDEETGEVYKPEFENLNCKIDFQNKKLAFYLEQAGFELNPKEHDLNKLTLDEIKTIRENLSMIYYLRSKNETNDMSPDEFINHCKSKYNNILDILNELSGSKTESQARTQGKTVFIYAEKNYIDGIFDGLNYDHRKYMKDNFLDYDEFTSNSTSSNYEERAYRMYCSLLRDLALSKERPDWFKIAHFFVNKENKKNPAKYADLTKDELAEINRKMFWKEARITKEGAKEYVWVHAPIYADKGTLHFYRVPNIEIKAEKRFPQSIDDLNNANVGELNEPQILTEIKNLIKFETNRIKEAKQRWELIKEGKLKAIDCYDIMKGKPGNAHKYCFQPMLNEFEEVIDKKTGKPKSVSLYDVMYADGVTDKQREEIEHEAAVRIYESILNQDILSTFNTTSGSDIYKNTQEGLQNIEKENITKLSDALRAKDYETYNKILHKIRMQDYEIQKQQEEYDKKHKDEETEEDENENKINNQERMIEKYQRSLTSYIRQADLLQLTVSDTAMYKNNVDVQKRYAQVQAGYSRPDVCSKYARRFMKTIYLKDFEIDLEKIDKEVFDRMEKTLRNAAKAANIDLDVDSIMKSFRNINVADAQCWRSLSSYRRVKDMFGQWSDKDEELFEKIRSGETLTIDDYTQVWQTLKPFVYTQQPSEWSDGKNTHKIKVGYQYKNSENVLFNMYMLFGGQDSALGQLNRFMEQYDIDTVQFESAVKVGREGLININNVEPDKIFDYLVEQTGVNTQSKEYEYDDVNGEKKTERIAGDPHVVHVIPYEEYGIKTSTPPHMFDTEQQLGSQLKKLLQGDIPDDAEIFLDTDGLLSEENLTTDNSGNVTFKVDGEEIELHKKVEKDENGKDKVRHYLDKEGYLKLFNGLLNDMILDEYGEVQEIFKDNERLGQALQEMMGTSPKYDYDIKQALKVKDDGRFVVDLKNPAIRDKVVLLMSSILKNRINKQLTRGGTAIQMTCWRGNVLKSDGTYDTLKIVRNPDGTVAYMEAMMPAYSKSFIESMINKDGILDPKKCKDENLLKALCYRVPTEDIYSMIPIKIVGFTPMQFGTNIMLPQEITTLTGSDFDVDKMYMFFPEFRYTNKLIEKNIKPTKTDKQKILHRVITARQNGDTRSFKDILKTEWEKYAFELKINAYINARQNKYADETLQDSWEREKQNILREKYWEEFKTRHNVFSAGNVRAKYSEYDFAKQDAAEQLAKEIKRRKELNKNPLTEEETKEFKKNIINKFFNDWIDRYGYRKRVEYITFDSDKDVADNSPAQKRNLLLALMRGAISSPHNITKEQNPGGFDYLKDLANDINKDVEIPMNLTESQYLNFFNLNMTGKRLIGIYANHNVAHALCQDSDLGLAQPIKIGEETYQSLHGQLSKDGRRISRNIAEFLAASVDNAKDPVLAKLWQNNYTASTTCFLMRLGVPVKTIVEMYKILKEKNADDFQKFMEKGPAAFKRYADAYNSTFTLGKSVTFVDGKKTKRTNNFFAMLGYYAQTIQNLETLNSLLKSDSTNGAMYDVTSIIENILKVNRLKADDNLVGVNNLIPDFTMNNKLLYQEKDEIKKAIKAKTGKNAKSYQVAYYLTWANYMQYFDKVIDRRMIDECIKVGMQLPKFNSDDIKKFITEYQKQQLKYINWFRPQVKKNKETGKYDIKSTNQIIKETLENTPFMLEDLKRKYPDNMFIKMLSRVTQTNKKTKEEETYLMIKNIADMRSETVNDVKQAFNDLYDAPESMNDALSLIKYAICVNGFGYDQRSFISMIPIKTLAAIGGIENMYDFFEIDHLDDFENNFIIDNDLVDYSFNIPNYDKEKPLFRIDGATSKIIGVREKYMLGNKIPAEYYKKVYENPFGCFYTSIDKEKELGGIESKIYDTIDKDILSQDTDLENEQINAIVEDVMKSTITNKIALEALDKDAIISVLKDKVSLGRYYNINSDPMTDYAPIAIEFC